MASNMALKRAAKANRRKTVVAEKRKLDILNDTLTAKALRAAQAPIQHCLVPETLFDRGIGTVILARGNTPHYLMLVLARYVVPWHQGHLFPVHRRGNLRNDDREVGRYDSDGIRRSELCPQTAA